METNAQQLAARLNDSLGSSVSPMSDPSLWRSLLHLLVQGEPVTIGQLSDASGRAVGEVRRALAGMPDTEYDQAGRIVGSCLTQNPTPHRFVTAGRTLYSWCALDTLIFPAVLGSSADVMSPCYATGTPIQLTVEPDRVTSVKPVTAVVSLVTPDAPASIRAAFCSHVHFFATDEDATGWVGEHPGSIAVPVTDACAIGQTFARRLFAGPAPLTSP